MKCFYHHDQDAVGVCRNCLKGICPQCAVEIGEGIACRDTCEEKAKDIAKLLSTNVNAHKGLKTGRFIGPLFAMISGVIFIGWNWYCKDSLSFTGMLGITFFAIGVIQLIYNLKYIRCDTEKTL